MSRFTHLLVGGGLHNGLTAMALHRLRPEARVALFERGASVGGNHTWCLPGAAPHDPARELLEPLVAFRWPRYEVRFPDRTRVLASAYLGFTSEDLARELSASFAVRPQSALLTGAEVVEVGAHHVLLADGQRFEGDLVIDARGPEQLQLDPDATGYQKFYGLDVTLAAPHGLSHPLLMDATVAQLEGYRFLYVLPLDERRVLVEDTRFATAPELDRPAMRAALLAELRRRGWTVAHEHRAEHGVLAMPWRGEVAPLAGSPVRAGYAGGWLHPATGYSLPLATRFALAVADGPADGALARLDALRRDIAKQLPYMHRLNRLLFQCFDPEAMWNVFSRFYGKPEPLIERFYALRTTPTDRTRILLGRPPSGVKLARALAILR